MSFYCKVTCGDPDFSIEEWNKSYLEIEAMPISQAEKDKLIHGEPCKKQCFDCMATVGKKQLETNELLGIVEINERNVMGKKLVKTEEQTYYKDEWYNLADGELNLPKSEYIEYFACAEDSEQPEGSEWCAEDRCIKTFKVVTKIYEFN